MVHPTLTVLFDLFLIGSAATVIASMVKEYLDSRVPTTGSTLCPATRFSEPAPLATRPPRKAVIASVGMPRPAGTRSRAYPATGGRRASTGRRSMAHVI